MDCYRNGGCGPYENRSCNECPASKPEYLNRGGKPEVIRENSGYVVVLNFEGPIPIRHIVGIHEPYNEATFKLWYYDEYHELEGDEFVYCKDMQEVRECEAEAKKKSDELWDGKKFV